jgi:hypothetical protein
VCDVCVMCDVCVCVCVFVCLLCVLSVEKGGKMCRRGKTNVCVVRVSRGRG